MSRLSWFQWGYLGLVFAGLVSVFGGTAVLALQPALRPDVIVGDIQEVETWGTDGDPTVFSVGTTSCNIGNAPLTWLRAPNPRHPAITQNLYRLRNGRLEQLAASWVKHGFAVLPQSLCNMCTDPASTRLGVGCSDPYTAFLNGDQVSLGPRSQISPRTGPAVNSMTGQMIAIRHLSSPARQEGLLQIRNLDIALDALYFVEGQYVHLEDAAVGADANNASYRRIFITPSAMPDRNATVELRANAAGQPDNETQRTRSAIDAWKVHEPHVVVKNIDVADDGRFNVGILSTPLSSGGFHNEIAIQNLTSARGARALSVATAGGAVSRHGFHDVTYDQEAYSQVDWSVRAATAKISWATDTFTMNPNANAIRWGTTYSFWFDSQEQVTSLTIDLFQPVNGQPDSITVDLR